MFNSKYNCRCMTFYHWPLNVLDLVIGDHFEFDCETLLGCPIASKTPAVCKRKQKLSSTWLRLYHCSNQSHWIVRYFWHFRMHYINLLTNAWFVCVLYNGCRCCRSTDVQKLRSHFVGHQRWRKNMNRYDTTCVTCFWNQKQHLRNALHGNWWQMLCWKHTRSSRKKRVKSSFMLYGNRQAYTVKISLFVGVNIFQYDQFDFFPLYMPMSV